MKNVVELSIEHSNSSELAQELRTEAFFKVSMALLVLGKDTSSFPRQ